MVIGHIAFLCNNSTRTDCMSFPSPLCASEVCPQQPRRHLYKDVNPWQIQISYHRPQFHLELRELQTYLRLAPAAFRTMPLGGKTQDQDPRLPLQHPPSTPSTTPSTLSQMADNYDVDDSYYYSEEPLEELTLLWNTSEVSRQKLRPLRNLLRKQEFLISVTFSQKRDKTQAKHNSK